MSVILMLFLVMTAYAQDFQYRLEGSFSTSAVPGETKIPAMVNYSISWNETATELQGIYSDNYFSPNSPNIVSGSIDASGRHIIIILPAPINEVRKININVSPLAIFSGPIPTTILTHNNVGSVIDNVSNSSLLTKLSEEDPSSDVSKSCVIGFGSLTGFCGLYKGIFSETSDEQNRCNLLTAGNPRLELGSDTVFRMHLNYVSDSLIQSSHTIGSFLPSPKTNEVNIKSRYCSELAGINFIQDHCKILNLSGIFFARGDYYTFTGTYNITDEVNGETCSYNLNLSRESKI